MYKSSTPSGVPNFTYGFLTGGLIIGGLALLFAPKKGKNLRKDLSKDINKATANLKNSASEYLNDAGDFLNSAKESAEELITEGTHKISSLLNSTESKIVDNAGNLVTEGKSKLNKMMDSTDRTIKEKQKSKHH